MIISDLAIDRVAVTPTDLELLCAQVQGEGLTTRLSLFDSQGTLLVQSDGVSPTNPDDVIEEHISVATYILQIQTLSGSGTYSLATSLTPSSDLDQPARLLPRVRPSPPVTSRTTASSTS